MSLWCDKHRPKTLAALDYHKEQADQLKKLVITIFRFNLSRNTTMRNVFYLYFS
jgi:hypothetical protein